MNISYEVYFNNRARLKHYVVNTIQTVDRDVTSADGTILEEGQRLELWQKVNMVTWKGRL